MVDTYYAEDFDADEQITLEELIAAAIFDSEANYSEAAGLRCFGEGDCQDLGKQILKLVVQQLRPDLLVVECPECGQELPADADNLTMLADHGMCHACHKLWQWGELPWQKEEEENNG